MRIIGGKYKGRKLPPIRSESLRPTSDRVRESIFNILSHRVSNAVVLDLFAGTGALGLEALSRGAACAVFMDQSAAAVGLINQALKAIGAEDAAQVIRWDISKNLNCIRSQGKAEDNRDGAHPQAPSGYNLVFLDPPYHRDLIGRALQHLHQDRLLLRDALIVAEHAADESPSAETAGFVLSDQRTYGNTSVSFLLSCQK